MKDKNWSNFERKNNNNNNNNNNAALNFIDLGEALKEEKSPIRQKQLKLKFGELVWVKNLPDLHPMSYDVVFDGSLLWVTV